MILEKYNEVVNLDVVATFTLPFVHKECVFWRSMRTVLSRSLERAWEQRDEGLGTGRPVLLLDDLDSDE